MVPPASSTPAPAEKCRRRTDVPMKAALQGGLIILTVWPDPAADGHRPWPRMPRKKIVEMRNFYLDRIAGF